MLILLIVLAEIGVAVLAFVFKNRVQTWMETVLKEGMILRYQDDEDALMDWFQERVSNLDWFQERFFNSMCDTNPLFFVPLTINISLFVFIGLIV